MIVLVYRGGKLEMMISVSIRPNKQSRHLELTDIVAIERTESYVTEESGCGVGEVGRSYGSSFGG